MQLSERQIEARNKLARLSGVSRETVDLIGDAMILRERVRKFLDYYEGNKVAQLGNGEARKFYEDAKLLLG